MRRSLLILTLLPCLSLAACEHGVDLDGTVTIPPEAQGLYAPYPEQLVVEATVPHVGTIVEIELLCSPDRQARVVPVHGFNFGCAVAGNARIRAWTRPIDVCEPRRPSDVPFEDARASAEVEVPIEILDSPGACNDGRIEFELTLAPAG